MNPNVPETSAPRPSSRTSHPSRSMGRNDASTSPIRRILLDAQNPELYGSPSTVDYMNESFSGRANIQQDNTPGSRLPQVRPFPPSYTRPATEHQWTLFGQLMQTDGAHEGTASDRDSGLSAPSGGGARRLSMHRASLLRLGARNRSPGTRSTNSNHNNNLNPTLLNSPVEENPASSRSPSPSRPLSDSWATSSGLDANRFRRTGETDYNSEDSDDEVEERKGDGEGYMRRKWRRLRSLVPTMPVVYRNVLKGAIAYFVASLFTFEPHLSTLFSGLVSYKNDGEEKLPLPSGHMVATIAVYFNPAKTMGAMIEADLFVLLGLFYSSFVCLGSMAMYWWLELKPGWEWLADLIVLCWIGFSMGVIAFLKVWMNNPSFNTACSMMAIIIFVVIVKEGGWETLLQVTAIVLCGSTISNVVCYFIWPQSATSNLQANMVKTLDSFSTVLSMLTKLFLLEDDTRDVGKLQRAVENHQNSFTSLKKDLGEAQTEWMYRDFNFDKDGATGSKGNSILRNEFASHRGYEDAVTSMNHLAQHLNGLRSGTSLQHELTKAEVGGQPGKARAVDDDESAILDAAADMFGDLVDELGPPLKALSGACVHTFKKLKVAFMKAKSSNLRPSDIMQPQDFIELAEGIERALVRFESTSNHALLRLYRKGAHLPGLSPGDLRGSFTSSYFKQGDAENTILTEDENEHVFLVYFFIFTLQEFAEELISLVDAMERIYSYERRRLLQAILALVRLCQGREGLARISSYIVPPHRVAHPFFPKVRPHAPDTIQTPSKSQLTLWGRLKYDIWEFGKLLKERNVKFAMRAGLAIALLASPAFFDSTRPFFVENQGDWALLSAFVVMSPTIGAVRAVTAASIFTIFPENAVALSIFGFFVSLPCFYVAVTRPKQMAATRFVLLTYNLTCLYRYNIREQDVGVWEIAIDRALAVTIGVLWALIASRIWWPAEARKELTVALGEFCLNIGWLYTRLVASNSFAPEYRADGTRDESQSESSLVVRNSQTTRLHNSIQEFMAMELHLQIKLIEIQNLLAQAQLEPRLKGPFPVKLYRDILTSLQTILDRLHSMRCVTTREEWYTSVRKDFIMPVNKERHEMVGNVILGLSIIASAFRLKAPLPPYLPPAEKSRQKLVAAIRQLDVVKNREVKGSRQLLFFAYAITMKGVTTEVEKLGKMLQGAFGVIGESSDAFDALFFESEERDRILDSVS
ncbi:hypothetical protein DFP72DRAFT_880344 [Ephemerocybe angulata]|uniref:DUF2421 domain-containing protein n=1 Tax=Ephemerocybe angulata TaxID=980116 RepID=A0A8H6M9S4_9AGAR|nr:hypothetical protein DFP72DRAFT_880344 [Tulosesus angulatus]